MATVHHRYITVDGHRLFFREAGDADAPALVLLHGFPTSSYMFRDFSRRWPIATASSRPTTWASASPTRRPWTSSTTHSTRSPT